jgi:hypothetical protein
MIFLVTLRRILHIHDHLAAHLQVHHVAHPNLHHQLAIHTVIIQTKIKITRKTKKNSKVKNNDLISV